ncbi:MAG: hypothetical protein KDJ27_17510 [Gammaproteobacteria bacterium]|nr:hypothetical protein [Gammaproteobacteria bacterium]
MSQPRSLITYGLLALSLAMGALEVSLNIKGEAVSDSTQSLWGFAFVVLSIMWAYADSKQKQFHKPFEFGFVAYVLWPLVFPWYLVSTRGNEGIVLFLGFLLLWLGPWMAGLVAYVYLT